jgi:putative phosphoribosyl transferase
MHFFSNRTEAGDKIADRLEERYRYEDTTIVALGDGAVLVGVEIAVRLHCVINMLLSSPEKAALEANKSAMLNSYGRTPYNAVYSAGDLENVDEDKFSYTELQKLVHEFEDGGLLGDGGLVSEDHIRYRNIILVSDGLYTGFSMQAASEFLKSLSPTKVIMAAPIISVPAMDEILPFADEIISLEILDELQPIEHYYENNDVPPHDIIYDVIQKVILRWQ